MTKPANSVDATSLTDRVCSRGHALIKEAVLTRCLVFAPPCPGIGLIVVVPGLGWFLIAGDICGFQAVGAGGIDENWEKRDGVENFD